MIIPKNVFERYGMFIAEHNGITPEIQSGTQEIEYGFRL
jgi:hypothetical protein